MNPRTSAESGGAAVAEGVLVLRLYIAGDAPNSALAEANLRELLRAREAGSFTLDIVDCIREPMRALADGVIVTPTLRKISPSPAQTIVGALSDTARVRATLGLTDGE